MSEQAIPAEPVTPVQVLAIAKQLGFACLGCPVGDGLPEDLRGCGGHKKRWVSRTVANIVAQGNTPKGGFPCAPITERVEAVRGALNNGQAH